MEYCDKSVLWGFHLSMDCKGGNDNIKDKDAIANDTRILSSPLCGPGRARRPARNAAIKNEELNTTERTHGGHDRHTHVTEDTLARDIRGADRRDGYRGG